MNGKMVRGTSRGDDIGKIFVGGLSTETTKGKTELITIKLIV